MFKKNSGSLSKGTTTQKRKQVGSSGQSPKEKFSLAQFAKKTKCKTHGAPFDQVCLPVVSKTAELFERKVIVVFPHLSQIMPKPKRCGAQMFIHNDLPCLKALSSSRRFHVSKSIS